MENKSAEIELVSPPPPPIPQRPPARAWLREVISPAPPESYVAHGEQCILATRRHWLVPLRDIARGSGMMAVIGVLIIVAPGLFLVQLVLLLSALAHTAWIGWCVLKWRIERIAVTDTRLIRVSGIITTTVDTVPLSEITDMSFRQSIPGRILDYGEIQIETAGQKRAIELLSFVPAPSTVYRALLLTEEGNP